MLNDVIFQDQILHLLGSAFPTVQHVLMLVTKQRLVVDNLGAFVVLPLGTENHVRAHRANVVIVCF